jgi:hypothetical protein
MLESKDILTRQLRELGIDIGIFAKSPILADLPQVKGAIHVSKSEDGKTTLTGVPETGWLFDGVIYFVDGLMFLIDKDVASKKRGGPLGI